MLAMEVSEAVAAIDAGLDVLGKLDVSGLAAGDLLDLAARCETAARRHSVVRHDLSHALHQRSVSELGGAPNKVLADWLRITPDEARRRARVSEPLAERRAMTGEPLPPHQPATAEAWRAGVLDGEHLRIIQRFLADLPFDIPPVVRQEAEAFLAEQAARLRPDQLAKVARQLALTVNPDGTFTDEDRARRRGFTWSPQRPDGMSVGTLVASPELRTMLDALLAKLAKPGMCNPADHTATVDGDPSEAQVAADSRSVGQRQHDALSALLRGWLGDPKLGQHNGLPVTVIVSATLQDIQDKAGYGLSASGVLVPMSDVIRMSAHAHHYLTLFDGLTGQPLWLGRTKRLASADQRIVLHAKDRGCSAPGCTVPGYGCQVHHAARDWSDGGATDIDELAFACKHHNLLVENHGWTTRKRHDGSTEWRPPPHSPLPGGVNDYHHPERTIQRFRQ